MQQLHAVTQQNLRMKLVRAIGSEQVVEIEGQRVVVDALARAIA